MNSLYLIFAIILLIRVKCNPVTELSTEQGDTTLLPTEDISLVNESAKDLAEEIETTVAAEVITSTDESTTEVAATDNCSHCVQAKYLNHYYAKGCTPIFGDLCKDCPKKFDCSQKEMVVGKDECLYNGTRYKVGEPVLVGNPCKVCQCGYGFTHAYTLPYTTPFTTIHCITVECPEHFGVHRFPLSGFHTDFDKLQNCYNIYEQNQCCAVVKKCLDPNLANIEKFCEYNEKKYRIGEKIYPNEDKCKVCICDENWDSNSTINNSGCYDVKCNLEIDRRLKDGCIPIYHESTCCPIEYHCPQKTFELDLARCNQIPDSGPCVGEFKRFYFDLRDGQCHSFVYSGCGGNTNNFRNLEECQQTCTKSGPNQNEPDEKNSEDNYCIFNDNKYDVGAKLDIGQKCVDCECRIPPDFTCIQKSCPTLPPSDCKVTYSPFECCPIFDCNYNKTNELPFDPLRCPTPMCQKGCLFETYPDKCPNCVCEATVNERELPDYDLSDV